MAISANRSPADWLASDQPTEIYLPALSEADVTALANGVVLPSVREVARRFLGLLDLSQVGQVEPPPPSTVPMWSYVAGSERELVYLETEIEWP